MKILKLIIGIFLLLNLQSVQAQEIIKGLELIDVIYLKNGQVFRGNIIEYQQGEKVTLQVEGQNLLVFEENDVLKIKQEQLAQVKKKQQSSSKVAPVKKDKMYKFKERGWYNVTYFAVANGRIENKVQFGVGLHNITGFMWKRQWGLGLGIGADNYAVGLGEMVYPVFAEFRGYFTPSFKSLYYSFSAGYGLAFKNENNFVTKANGGYVFHPAIGIRLGASAESNVTIDLGYKQQQAGFTRETPFTGEIDIREIVYKRITIRAGLLF